MTDRIQMDDFDTVWTACAEESICDGFGGSEYQRVRHEWHLAGRPHDIRAFIELRANVGPDDDAFPETDTTVQ